MMVVDLMAWLTAQLTHTAPVLVLDPALLHLGQVNNSLVVHRSGLLETLVLAGIVATGLMLWLSMARLGCT